MNYKKTKTHEYIRNFLIINNYLYQNDYVSKKLTCENIIEQKKIWEYSFETEQIYLTSYQENLFIGDGNSSLLLDSSNGKALVSSNKLGFNFRLYTNFTDLIVIEKNKSILESIQGVYDLKNQVVCFLKDDIYPFAVYNNIIIGKSKNSISRYDNQGILEWYFPLSNHGHWYNEFDKKWEEGEVCHFVGVVDGILWVDVTAHVLLGIDIHTGQIRYNLKETIAMNEFSEKFPIYKPHYGKTTFDQKQHKLWGTEGYSYWEVDLNEPILNLKLWYMGDECESHFTSLPNFDICGITQDYIFFPMGGLGGNRKAQVAALNRKTMKIDWQYLFTSDTPYYTPTKVEVSEDHLFVLDSEGTLNIFEKEKVA